MWERWFSVVCTLMDDDIRHHSGQNDVDSRGAPQQILTTVVTNIVVDDCTDNAKPLSICFFYHNIQHKRKCLLQSVTKIVTQRKSKRCLTFSQYDWFISQNERS